MQTTSKELYHFWSLFSKLLNKKTDPPAIVRKFEKKSFEEILKESFYETANMPKGYVAFVDLANAINMKKLSFTDWIYICIGDFLKDGQVKKKNLLNLNYLQKNIKFYSVNGKQEQFTIINKMLEEAKAKEDPFAAFTGNQFDLYKVNDKQKNKLYELIRNGTLNFWFWFDGIDNNKFAIDETKIDDPDYFRFLRLMRIVRQKDKRQ
ncbi:hypothetical protein [Candidatus Ruminimicrobium bovinum]|uniref:hypothetical protein n=1 Tax=Candidatus Ruminimicrobium bovinum TaxID=3242779 RepID=UPI0039B82FCF